MAKLERIRSQIQECRDKLALLRLQEKLALAQTERARAKAQPQASAPPT